jgi:hypothetical protein
MGERSDLPRPLKRAVLVEAGHRCAIPTCRSIPVEIAHIDARAKGGADEFDNLIALCPTCHTRYDAGGIDRSAMLQYKANLALLNSRYGDVERRVIEWFAVSIHDGIDEIRLPHSLDILMWHLRDDGMVEVVRRDGGTLGGDSPADVYRLTERGRELVERVRSHREID